VSEPEIQVRPNGPYRVQGPIRLVDIDGHVFDLPGEIFALCRCGHSQTKPFCDGSHKTSDFQANTRAVPVEGEPSEG